MAMLNNQRVLDLLKGAFDHLVYPLGPSNLSGIWPWKIEPADGNQTARNETKSTYRLTTLW